MNTRAIARPCTLAGFTLVCLTLFGGLTPSSAAHDQGFSIESPSTAGFSLSAAHFAIGDFDGDQKLDLASVQADPSSERVTRYSIHLQLSLGKGSAIGLTAPFGGLLLSAKDVNGDSTLDLVVTAAIDHHLVAVLVNDGHGHFSLAAEEAFPKLSAENSCQIHLPSGPSSSEAPLLQSRSLFGEEGENATACESPARSESFLIAEQQEALRWHGGASSGRSPPACRILP